MFNTIRKIAVAVAVYFALGMIGGSWVGLALFLINRGY